MFLEIGVLLTSTFQEISSNVYCAVHVYIIPLMRAFLLLLHKILTFFSLEEFTSWKFFWSHQKPPDHFKSDNYTQKTTKTSSKFLFFTINTSGFEFVRKSEISLLASRAHLRDQLREIINKSLISHKSSNPKGNFIH